MKLTNCFEFSIKSTSTAAVAFVLYTLVFFACERTTRFIDAPHYEKINGAMIYDYDPSTRLGDEIYGTIVADFENDHPGRNAHGGQIAMEYANGDLVVFYSNADGHTIDGWSEYSISKDGGRTWDMYNKFKYSYDTYQNSSKQRVRVEEGLVTSKGAVVLFMAHFYLDHARTNSGFMRSYDHGVTWSEYQPVDGSFVGYSASVEVDGETNFVLFDDADMRNGPHVLYVSTDDGRSWDKRSTLPLDNSAWYGALCFMEDGRLLAGAYKTEDEYHFYYCISDDQGHTWSEQRRTYLDKKIRDPELAYLAGHYYLFGRSGHSGEGSRRFVMYQSEDGENWGEGIIVSSLAKGLDGYTHNTIINKYNDDIPNELMVNYSIMYEGYQDRNTNSYVFFIRPLSE